MLFCCKAIAFDPYHYKPGSKERGQCLNIIGKCLNSVKESWFKLDQRLLRDRTKKLLKLYVEKRNKEMRASGVEVERTELNDLLLDVHRQQYQAEVKTAEASEANNKKFDKEREKAEETRRLPLQRLLESLPKQKKPRSSGTDTIVYLREKTKKDFELRAKKLKLKRELDMKKQRQEASENHMEMRIQSSQQQMNAMLLLIGKLTQKR